MPKRPTPSAVVFAKNMAAMAKFYETIAVMSVVHADEAHIILGADGFQLVIHSIPQAIADTFEITEPPVVRKSTPIKLCLPILSIADAREKAPSFGGEIEPKSKEWEAGGFRACDGYDPEGNVIQVRESVL